MEQCRAPHAMGGAAWIRNDFALGCKVSTTGKIFK